MKRLKAYVSNPVERAKDADLPYVALEHVESGTGHLLPGVQLESSDADNSIAHQAGDVRFGKLRPYLAKSVLMSEPGTGSGELLVLRPDPSALDARYLWYLTLSKPFLEWAEATSYGVKMPRTSWEALGSYKIDPPPLDEQRSLVALLDTAITRIDELVLEQERLLSLLEARRWRFFIAQLECLDAPPVALRRAFSFLTDGPFGSAFAIPVVAARLSHARASTTLNVYAHAVPGGDREAAEGISALLRDAR